MQCLFTDGNGVGESAMLQRQQAGHHFGEAGRFSPCIDVLGVHHGFRVQLQQE